MADVAPARERPTIPFVLSLMAGLLILAGSGAVVTTTFSASGPSIMAA